MELKRYFNIVFQWWWLVLIGFIVVTISGFAFSFSQPPMYRSSITLVVSPKSTIADLSAVRQSLDTLDNDSIINTYAEIARSRKILEQAQKAANLPDASMQELEILVNVIAKTNLIRIDVEGHHPQSVFRVANQVGEESITYVNNLYELYEIKVLDAAVLPQEPYSPEVVRDTGLSAVLGLLLGICSTFVAEYMRRPMEVFEALSIIDHETGLYNKRYFMQRLNEEISRSKRKNQAFAVCLIHSTVLSSSQETIPINVFQTMFRQVAAHIKRNIRQDELVARWDDHCIAWLLLDASESTTRQAIDRLCGLIERKKFEDIDTGIQIYFTGSFGAAIFSGEQSASDLMILSEQALSKTSPSMPGNVLVVHS